MGERNLEPIEEESKIYNCTSCGSSLEFDPDSQTMKCPYCKTSVPIEEDKFEIQEKDFFKSIKEKEVWVDKATERVIKCENCGATTVLDAKVTASRCAFCDSPHVLEVKDEDDVASIRPESLIPFKINEEKAKNLFTEWLKKKFFAPKEVKEQHILENIKGVYIPHWTFDSNTFTRYSCSVGEHYHVKQGDKTVTKTKWHRKSGHHTMFIDDELINASRNVDQKKMKALEPFHFNELVPFKQEYLSGFMAEKYGIDLEEGWGIAKQHMKQDIERTIKRGIHGDEIRNFSTTITFRDITYKHILLPIFVASYKFNNKVYNFYVNGQTGEVQGKAPIDKLKVAIATIIGAGVVAGAYYILEAI